MTFPRAEVECDLEVRAPAAQAARVQYTPGPVPQVSPWPTEQVGLFPPPVASLVEFPDAIPGC